MKKCSLLLAIILLFTFCANAMAATVDLSYVRNDPDTYEIDVQVEDDLAFIETTYNAAELSFVHKYESTNLYSGTRFDMLVIDYLQSDAYPVFRLWLTYCADDNYINASSVTFEVSGKKYTFSDIGDPDWYYHDEDGYMEQMLIKFNDDNLDFLVALENLLPETYEELLEIKIPLTLHGREDIKTEVGSGFLMDFLAMKLAYVNANGLDFLSEPNGTPMKVH